MSVKELNHFELCRRLGEGWTPEQAEAPRELLLRLSARWHAHLEHEQAGRSAFRGVLELPHVRLQGASELGCLVLGGGADAATETRAFWDELGGTGRLGLVLTRSSNAAESSRLSAPNQRCVFLADGEVEALLNRPHPLAVLKQHLRDQIPRRRLLPYNITQPVAPNMFFGRDDLLERFHAEEQTSFAVAGPGRIGKSSMLRQYGYQLRTRRDDRRQRLQMINCYSFGELDPGSLARRIALTISADSEANRTNQDTLERFLKRHSQDGRQPLELLLDEVDGVCLGPVFQKLGEAVKQGFCRVIMCGKGSLHRMMREKRYPLADRLELIQPEPLDPESAAKLLFEPVNDLGFKIEVPPVLRERVFELTRRLPQLIQACAKQMVELALADNQETITLRHFERVREKWSTVGYGRLPLRDMEDDTTRLVALLLLEAGGLNVTIGHVETVAEQAGVPLNASEALDICHDLWVCNVLTVENGKFVLANPSLVEFAHKMDFLGREIRALKRSVIESRFQVLNYSQTRQS